MANGSEDGSPHRCFEFHYPPKRLQRTSPKPKLTKVASNNSRRLVYSKQYPCKHSPRER